MKSVVAKRRLAQEWAGVRRYHDWIKASTLGGVGFVSSRFLDFCHSLVLVHAYSVLQAALQQYRQEHAFVAKGGELAVLMRASRTVLGWQDYGTVNAGRAKRNAVAHKGQFLPRSESWQYIRAIEGELVAWRVVRTQPPWWARGIVTDIWS
jgi:hypothetical protein